MLIKSTSGDPPTTSGAGRVYVLCTDGSEASRLAACFLSFLSCDADHIHVIHVSEYAEQVDEEELLRPYEKLFKSEKDNVSFEVIESMYSVTAATTIIDYAQLKDADFIVMGTPPARPRAPRRRPAAARLTGARGPAARAQAYRGMGSRNWARSAARCVGEGATPSWSR